MSELSEQLEDYLGRLVKELKKTRRKKERAELERRIKTLRSTLTSIKGE